jgi:two-component system chemotaxis response regulator CheB
MLEVRRHLEATCPDCRGPLTEVTENGVVEYRCLVGHRYSAMGLLHAHSDTQERALWSAVVVLEEAAVIANEVATQMPAAAHDVKKQGEEKARQAATIRQLLNELKPFTTE